MGNDIMVFRFMSVALWFEAQYTVSLSLVIFIKSFKWKGSCRLFK